MQNTDKKTNMPLALKWGGGGWVCKGGGGDGKSGRGSLALMRCQSAASTLSAQLGR